MVRNFIRMAALSIVLAAAPAWANQITTIAFSDAIPVATTSWNDFADLGKFDTNLGTLLSIDVFLDGKVEGSTRFESLDPSPTTVTVNLSSTVTLKKPDSSTLSTAFPVFTKIEPVSPFDGGIDFGGGSGRTFLGLSAINSDHVTLTGPFSALDLAAFTAPGGGALSLPVMSVGTSNGSGSGNLLLQFTTMAGADVRIVYTYKAVPEPATLALLAAGALGLRRRR
ncbi:MAG: choice-of-anchor E domain-containing protein [Phycisphaerae bacterium]